MTVGWIWGVYIIILRQQPLLEFVDLYQNFVHKCIKFIKTLIDVHKHCIIELMSISLPPKFLTYDRFQYVLLQFLCNTFIHCHNFQDILDEIIVLAT
jgi:hypothetical protein